MTPSLPFVGEAIRVPDHPSEERRIYQIGQSLFRVWVDRPNAGAEYFKDDGWVWTPIPSGNIMDHPRAQELSEKEFERIRTQLRLSHRRGIRR